MHSLSGGFVLVYFSFELLLFLAIIYDWVFWRRGPFGMRNYSRLPLGFKTMQNIIGQKTSQDTFPVEHSQPSRSCVHNALGMWSRVIKPFLVHRGRTNVTWCSLYQNASLWNVTGRSEKFLQELSFIPLMEESPPRSWEQKKFGLNILFCLLFLYLKSMLCSPRV